MQLTSLSNEPPFDGEDTTPLRSYESLIQQEAHQSFERLRKQCENLDPTDPASQFWYDFLKVMEYAILK